jgi:hypothetical protein
MEPVESIAKGSVLNGAWRVLPERAVTVDHGDDEG